MRYKRQKYKDQEVRVLISENENQFSVKKLEYEPQERDLGIPSGRGPGDRQSARSRDPKGRFSKPAERKYDRRDNREKTPRKLKNG